MGRKATDYTRHTAPTYCLPFKSAWASVLINRRRHNEPTQTDRSTWHNVRLVADQRNIRKPETKSRWIWRCLQPKWNGVSKEKKRSLWHMQNKFIQKKKEKNTHLVGIFSGCCCGSFTFEDGLQPLPTKLGTVNGTKIMGVVPTAVGWGINSAVAVPTPSRQLQAVTSSCGVCWTPAAAVVAVWTVPCCVEIGCCCCCCCWWWWWWWWCWW